MLSDQAEIDYHQLDADTHAKLTYGLHIANVFGCVFSNSHAWTPTLFYSHAYDYFRRMSYLIGA